MFSIDVVAPAPDDPSLPNVFYIENHGMQLPVQRLMRNSRAQSARTTSALGGYSSCVVLLEWKIHGCSGKDKLDLPEAHTKTWLSTGPFGNPGTKNKPQQVTPEKCNNWIFVEEEPVWGTEVKHNRLRKRLDKGFSEQKRTTHPTGDTPLRQYVFGGTHPAKSRPRRCTAHVLRLHPRYRGLLYAVGKLFEPQELRTNDRKDQNPDTHTFIWPYHNPN